MCRVIAAVVATLFLLVGQGSISRLGAAHAGGQEKTLHVKEYKKKDGTKVREHKRKPPKAKSSGSSKGKSSTRRKK